MGTETRLQARDLQCQIALTSFVGSIHDQILFSTLQAAFWLALTCMQYNRILYQNMGSVLCLSTLALQVMALLPQY